MGSLHTLAGRGLSCGLLLVASSAALAQEVRERTTIRTDERTGTTEVRRVTEVIGSAVVLQGETRYGKVEDIVFNENGCIDYIVVSAEDRYAVLPWAAGRLDYRQRVVTFDVDRDQLQPLIIEGNDWATAIGQPDFTRQVQRVFGDRAIRREQPGGDVRPRGAERREERREQRREDRRERQAEARDQDRSDLQPQPKDAPRERRQEARPGEGDRPQGKAAAKGREGRDRDDRDRERRKDEPKKPQS
jgi:hypothetical protein